MFHSIQESIDSEEVSDNIKCENGTPNERMKSEMPQLQKLTQIIVVTIEVTGDIHLAKTFVMDCPQLLGWRVVIYFNYW